MPWRDYKTVLGSHVGSPSMGEFTAGQLRSVGSGFLTPNDYDTIIDFKTFA